MKIEIRNIKGERIHERQSVENELDNQEQYLRRNNPKVFVKVHGIQDGNTADIVIDHGKTIYDTLTPMILASHTVWERKPAAKSGLSLSNSHLIGSVRNSLTTAKIMRILLSRTTLIAGQTFYTKQGLQDPRWECVY